MSQELRSPGFGNYLDANVVEVNAKTSPVVLRDDYALETVDRRRPV